MIINDSALRGRDTFTNFAAKQQLEKINGGESLPPLLSRREQLEGERAALDESIESLTNRWLPQAGRAPLPSRSEMLARIGEFQLQRVRIVSELQALNA